MFYIMYKCALCGRPGMCLSINLPNKEDPRGKEIKGCIDCITEIYLALEDENVFPKSHLKRIK